MAYPETLQYQGETIYLLNAERVNKIAGKPIRVTYGTWEGKVRLTSYDFGKGVDWQAIEAANLHAPIPEPKITVLKTAKPKKTRKTKQPYVSKSAKPRGAYERLLPNATQEEKEAIFETRRLARNAKQKAYMDKQKALLPPKPPKPVAEKPVKVKKEKPAKPSPEQQFSLGGKDSPRANQPKLETKAMVVARKSKVQSPALGVYLAQLEQEKLEAGADWWPENAETMRRLAEMERK